MELRNNRKTNTQINFKETDLSIPLKKISCRPLSSSLAQGQTLCEENSILCYEIDMSKKYQFFWKFS